MAKNRRQGFLFKKVGEGVVGVKISAIVLVGGSYDKELLRKCLNSLAWTDEIIKVETDKLPGSFAQWRNEGAKRAKGNWLLYVDSDEQVSRDLKLEILNLFRISNLEFGISAYAIPRQNILLGKCMRFGGWWPDYVVRLIQKDALFEWEGDLHEQPKVKGQIGKLKEPLLHTSHRTISEMVAKTNEWSEIEARLLFKAGHPKMTWWRFFSAAFREFWYRGVVKFGFLDGTVGIIEIVYQVFSRLVTYSKLWEKQLSATRT